MSSNTAESYEAGGQGRLGGCWPRRGEPEVDDSVGRRPKRFAPPLLHGWIRQLEFSLQAGDSADARGAIFDAAAQLRESLIFDARYAEAHILRAMVHAQLLKVSGGSVPYDPAIGASLAQLALREPRNPKRFSQQASSRFLCPRCFRKRPPMQSRR